jgi:TRAP-type C4-dicarboxylate transport system substrate-binding protein
VAFKSAAARAGQQMQSRSRQESDQAVAAMKKRGLQVHGVSPELDAEWRQFAEGVYPMLRGNLVPAEMFDEVTRLIAEYRNKEVRGQ